MSSHSDSAVVVAGQIITFLPGLNAQQIEDITNSCLFSQLAASTKYDRHADVEQWYKSYVTVLGQLGWIISNFDFQAYTEAQTLRSSDKTLLVFLAKFLPESSYRLIDETMTDFRKLNPKEKPVVVLNSSSVVEDSANFQIGVASNSSRGPTINFGAFVYKVSEKIENPLSHFWGDSSVTFKAATQNIILNEAIYSQVRELVVQKLGGKIENLIADCHPARFFLATSDQEAIIIS